MVLRRIGGSKHKFYKQQKHNQNPFKHRSWRFLRKFYFWPLTIFAKSSILEFNSVLNTPLNSSPALLGALHGSEIDCAWPSFPQRQCISWNIIGTNYWILTCIVLLTLKSIVMLSSKIPFFQLMRYSKELLEISKF